jgi:hypothetical protein
VLVSVALVTTILAPPATAGADSPHPARWGGRHARKGPALPGLGSAFGAYVSINEEHAGGPGEQDAQLGFEDKVGRKMAYVKEGYFWDDQFPGEFERWARDQGQTLVFGWSSTKQSGDSVRWADIAAGLYDADIDAKANELMAFEAPALFVFENEPEQLLASHGSAADYVLAYQHIRDRFVSRGVTNLSYVLILMAYTYRMGRADQYYPGDGYVDVLAADGYNWYGCPGRDDPWTSFVDVFQAFNDYGMAKGKPMFIAEWGSMEDPAVPGRKAEWIGEAADTLKGWPEVKVVTYYNNGMPAGNCDWWVDSSDSALAAFQEMGADPYFNPAPPLVTIRSAPPDPDDSGSARFTFNSNVRGTVFTCSMDGGIGVPCVSGHTFTGLWDGVHTAAITATDPATQLFGTVEYAWTVDTVDPTLTINWGPEEFTRDTSASFNLVSSEAVPPGYFTCQLDGGAVEECGTWIDYEGLADGAHLFVGRAYDEAGNASLPVQRIWTVDTVAPVGTIVSGPAALSNTRSSSFAFTSTEPGGTFKCRRDGLGYVTCTSPKIYNGLSDGPHTFYLVATDRAGNQAVEVSWTWTIDATKPTVTITSGPANPTASRTATFTFTSSEVGAVFTCALDYGAGLPCVSGVTYLGLTPGTHTFSVFATDLAGNAGAKKNWRWRIT